MSSMGMALQALQNIYTASRIYVRSENQNHITFTKLTPINSSMIVKMLL